MLSKVTLSSGVAVHERTLKEGAEGMGGGKNRRRGRLSSVRHEHLNEDGRGCEIVSDTSWSDEWEECGVDIASFVLLKFNALLVVLMQG